MEITLKASGAETTTGQGTSINIGNRQRASVAVNVSAGSGTVSAFRVWLEGTYDGTNWHELICDKLLKSGAAAPGAATLNQRDIVNETSVQTAAKYYAEIPVGVQDIRAAWLITGTTPSETFNVLADVV